MHCKSIANHYFIVAYRCEHLKSIFKLHIGPFTVLSWDRLQIRHSHDQETVLPEDERQQAEVTVCLQRQASKAGHVKYSTKQ